ncbi:hypothetical protein PR048_001312 [Dryococelus australis]|uniref:Uncharacterized protein n=1 Tax=Dryococelus australis TaxID=614101 RepID=A0ABQ9II01_9NEOP|nr:hypothetical protein PR048_001312 [Dryococelus australis]
MLYVERSNWRQGSISNCLILPEFVRHAKTFSDTCGGQIRNIRMAIMFSVVMREKPSLQVIDQKFLLPGHTRLECDSDHARIERAKKQIDESMKIMVPRDWYHTPSILTHHSEFWISGERIKGRPICADSISIPGSHTKHLEINPLRNKRLVIHFEAVGHRLP